MLVQVSGSIQGIANGKALLEQPFREQLQGANFTVDYLTLPPNTLRHTLVTTLGARIVYIQADYPVTVYHGRSLQGYTCSLLVESGDFPEGLSITTGNNPTEVVIATAKEGGS